MDPVFSLLEMVSPKENTFQDVGYFVSGKVNPKLIEMLDTGGARQKAYPTIGVTHFIAGEGADRDKMDEAKDIFDIPIVSPRWIMYSTHQGKILPANWFLAEGKELFAGLTFTTSGLRDKDLITAWAIVTFHNGTFLRHLTKECTHLICNEATGRKYGTAKQLNLPIVCVDWLTDSLKHGIRLNEKSYDPRLLRPPSSPKVTMASIPPSFRSKPISNSSPLPSTMLNSVEKSLRQTKLDSKEVPDWIRESGGSNNKQKRNSVPTQSKILPNTHINGMDRTTIPAHQSQSDQLQSKTPAPPSATEETKIPTSSANLPTSCAPKHAQVQAPPQVQVQAPSQVHVQAPSQVQIQAPSQVQVQAASQVQVQPPSIIRRPSGGLVDSSRVHQIQQQSSPPPNATRPASVEQLEIIQMIQNDPQIKLQWAHMDHTQRMLLVQKLAQKSREERLRKEMMLKQQQMQMNHPTHQPQNLPLSSAGIEISSSAPVQTSSRHSSPVVQTSQGGGVPYLNHEIRPRFSQPMGRQGDHFQQPRTQPIMAEDFGKDVTLMEAQSTQQQQQAILFGQQQQQQNTQAVQQNIENQGQSHQQQQQQQTIFFRGNLGPSALQQQQQQIQHLQLQTQQRQILVAQHQSGAIVRTGTEHLQAQVQSFSPPDDSLQRILTPQLPQTPNQKVQAYLQNSILPMQQLQQQNQQQQQQLMTVTSGSAPSAQVSSMSQFYGPTTTTTTMSPGANQLRNNATNRQVPIGQGPPQQQQTPLVDPHSSPQQSAGQRDHFQWSPTSTSSSPGSFNSLSNSPQSQQRLISPTGAVTSRQTRPPSSDPQQQQWSTALRSQSPQLIYTTQANMPYSQQVMNQKTKTALANLLSNRLMGSTTPDGHQVAYTMSCGSVGAPGPSRSPSPLAPPPPPPPPPASNLNIAHVANRVPSALSGKQPPQHHPHALQRRTLSNLTNNDKGALATTNNVVVPLITPPSPTPSFSSPSTRLGFLGHDPTIKLPESGFLLGCVFWAAQELRIPRWFEPVLKWGGEVETSYTSRVTHVVCETQKFPEFQQCLRDRKRLVTLFWLNDTLNRRCVASPSQAVHLPLAFSENEKPYFGELVSTSGFTGEEKERVQVMCIMIGLVPTSFFTRAAIGLVAKFPEGEKFLKAREWRKPVVNIQFLNELLFGHTGVIQMIHSPKYQQFNTGAPFSFDVALVAPLMAPWRTPIRVANDAIQNFRTKRPHPTDPSAASPVLHSAAKRLKFELEEVVQSGSRVSSATTTPDSNDAIPELATELKPSLTPPASTGVFVMMTGFSDELKEVMKEKIEELGGRVTKDRHVATHLIVKENCVTKSLVTFLCSKDTIVGIDWLRFSYAERKFIDVEPYRLTSGVCGIHQINYAAILRLPNRNRLFSGLTFFLTPSVVKDVKEIIEAAGGRIVTEKYMHKVYESAMKNLESYVIVTCEDDEYLLSGWKDNDGLDKIIIVTRDTILAWIIKQDVGKESQSLVNKLDFPSPAKVSSGQHFVNFDESGPGDMEGEGNLEETPMEIDR